MARLSAAREVHFGWISAVLGRPGLLKGRNDLNLAKFPNPVFSSTIGSGLGSMYCARLKPYLPLHRSPCSIHNPRLLYCTAYSWQMPKERTTHTHPHTHTHTHTQTLSCAILPVISRFCMVPSNPRKIVSRVSEIRTGKPGLSTPAHSTAEPKFCGEHMA